MVVIKSKIVLNRVGFSTTFLWNPVANRNNSSKYLAGLGQIHETEVKFLAYINKFIKYLCYF
jgi:hypothetical protein